MRMILRLRLLLLLLLLDVLRRVSADLETILTIDWKRLPDLPRFGPLQQGFQDSDGGVLEGDVLVTAFGYAGAGHFLNSAYVLRTVSDDTWREIPSAPVSGRQEVGATTLPNDDIVFVGGFNYETPYTYGDVLKLSKKNDAWSWSVLPSLPYPLCSMGVASIGSIVYVFGGADYDAQTGFHTFTDRNGGEPGLGKRLFALDTNDTSTQWKRLPDIPGSPRMISAFSVVGNQILVIGGATSNGSTVVDNFAFDPSANAWSALPDLPVSSGNFQTNGAYSFEDRYVILVGGYAYGSVYRSNGTISKPYGQSQRMCPSEETSEGRGCRANCPASATIVDRKWMGGDTWATEYDNDIFVYDAHRRTFGKAVGTSSTEPSLMPSGCGGLPINDNLPQTNIRGSNIYVIGGECNDRYSSRDGYNYTHYPRLALVGKISAA